VITCDPPCLPPTVCLHPVQQAGASEGNTGLRTVDPLVAPSSVRGNYCKVWNLHPQEDEEDLSPPAFNRGRRRKKKFSAPTCAGTPANRPWPNFCAFGCLRAFRKPWLRTPCRARIYPFDDLPSHYVPLSGAAVPCVLPFIISTPGQATPPFPWPPGAIDMLDWTFNRLPCGSRGRGRAVPAESHHQQAPVSRVGR
jgi:hypothetical protein